MWLVSVTRSHVWMGSRCVKFRCYRSHSLILVTGSSTWHLMAKNSEDLKKIIVALHKDGVGYKKIAKTLKLSCNTVAKTIQRFRLSLRTGLAMVDQRSWVHVLSVISRGCVWEIDVWVLPTFLQRLKGWGVSLSVLRPYAAHCIKLVCMAVVPEGSLF